jgi:hypothetical protein
MACGARSVPLRSHSAPPADGCRAAADRAGVAVHAVAGDLDVLRLRMRVCMVIGGGRRTESVPHTLLTSRTIALSSIVLRLTHLSMLRSLLHFNVRRRLSYVSLVNDVVRLEDSDIE